jgi:hypothetical protein
MSWPSPTGSPRPGPMSCFCCGSTTIWTERRLPLLRRGWPKPDIQWSIASRCDPTAVGRRASTWTATGAAERPTTPRASGALPVRGEWRSCRACPSITRASVTIRLFCGATCPARSSPNVTVLHSPALRCSQFSDFPRPGIGKCRCHPEAGTRLTLLTWHAGPPAFGGPQERNRRRNHDETAFWLHFSTDNELPMPTSGPALRADGQCEPRPTSGRRHQGR